MESSIFGNIGVSVTVDQLGGESLETLFSEAQSGVVVSVSADNANMVTDWFADAGVPCFKLGTVGGDKVTIGNVPAISVSELKSIYETAIPNAMNSK